MTDYLGPLELGTSGTYQLEKLSVRGSEASLEVVVQGTSADTLATACEALAAQLYEGNSYAHFLPGVTLPVVYRVVGASSIEADETEGPLAFWMRCKFTLNLAGMPAGALTTLYAAQHVDSPASASLSALLGTHPTALDVTIDDDAGTDMHSVLCALAPTALSDAKWLVMASALTWTTMSAGTGATYWGNSNRYTTSASYQTAPLDTSPYPAGKYRLLARVCQEAGTGYIKDSQNDVAVAITRTTPHILVIGDLDLPVADTAPGVAANLTISVKSDGTNDCLLNALLLIPLDYGYFSWHPSTPTTEIDQLDVGPSGIFMDGITDTTHFISSGILVPRVLAAHTGTLVSPASPAASWPSAWGRTSGDRTNYCTNPNFALSTGGLADGWAATIVNATVTPTMDTMVIDGVTVPAQRVRIVGGAGVSPYPQIQFVTGVGTLANGETVTGSVYLEVLTATGCTPAIVVQNKDAAAAWIASSTMALGSVGAPARLSATLTASSALTSRIDLSVTCDADFHDGDVLEFKVARALIEKSAALLPYFDGSYPSAAWSATAHASTSTKGEVAADSTGLLFEVATTTGSKYAWFAATNAATPLVVPGAWYEVDLTRQVTARSAGAATVDLIWTDIDGNVVRTDALSTTSATDATPVALELYAKAPAHAARAMVRVGAGTGANLTAYFSGVVLRRCPLRMIVVAEDAAGALTNNSHPIHLTCRYTPRYEIAR